MADDLKTRVRNWSELSAVDEVWSQGYINSRTGAGTAIFTASEIIRDQARCLGCYELAIEEAGNDDGHSESWKAAVEFIEERTVDLKENVAACFKEYNEMRIKLEAYEQTMKDLRRVWNTDGLYARGVLDAVKVMEDSVEKDNG